MKTEEKGKDRVKTEEKGKDRVKTERRGDRDKVCHVSRFRDGGFRLWTRLAEFGRRSKAWQRWSHITE